jgi:hypothetical protein
MFCTIPLLKQLSFIGIEQTLTTVTILFLCRPWHRAGRAEPCRCSPCAEAAASLQHLTSLAAARCESFDKESVTLSDSAGLLTMALVEERGSLGGLEPFTARLGSTFGHFGRL